MAEMIEDAEENEIDAERDNMSENGDGKGKFKFDSTMRRDEAVAYFEAIVSGLKQGSVHFKQGDRSLTVKPAPVLEVEVKASKKGKEAKLSFEISWRPEHESELEISAS